MSAKYKWHTVFAGALRDESGGKFIPVAYITWSLTPSESGCYALILPERFFTFDEATDSAFVEAKAWVDKHVDDLTDASERAGLPSSRE
jgi:hypothetical protein